MKIEIAPYNPEWPLEFKLEAIKIKQALGSNCLCIHHIGSTSIPNLSAKPIIDIIPVVKDICRVNNKNMEALSYEGKGEYGIPFRLYFQKNKELRTHNVHIFEQGNTEIDRHLKFRDWMRKNPDDRNEYEILKTALAAKFPNDIMAYCLGKEEFINNIDVKAGFSGFKFVNTATPNEWKEYHRIIKVQIFDPINIRYNKNHPSITENNCFHFVLSKDSQIVSAAMIEFIDKNIAAIRFLATDEPYKKKGYGSYIIKLLEKWIKSKGYNIIKLHANPDYEIFYRKLGYNDIEFDDISISEDNIDLGKFL
ncbi:MAG: GNAT family N-acetyltransferase [Rickettsiales bacterium]